MAKTVVVTTADAETTGPATNIVIVSPGNTEHVHVVPESIALVHVVPASIALVHVAPKTTLVVATKESPPERPFAAVDRWRTSDAAPIVSETDVVPEFPSGAPSVVAFPFDSDVVTPDTSAPTPDPISVAL
jgi:hypothetical protein